MLTVYLMPNGMVMTFWDGEQVPPLQGRKGEVWDAIKALEANARYRVVIKVIE